MEKEEKSPPARPSASRILMRAAMRAAAGVAAILYGLPAFVRFFPTAETTLAEQGLPPSLVQELAPGKKVYVLKESLPAKIAMFLRMRTTGWAYLTNNDVAAFSNPAHMPFDNSCAVYLKPRVLPGEELRSNRARFRDRGTPQPLSEKEEAAFVLLHEITHCGKRNINLKAGMEKEGDATFSAGEAMARHGIGDQDLQKRIVLDNAYGDENVWPPPTHDIALYLDARFRAVAVPPLKEMEESNARIKDCVLKTAQDIKEKRAGGTRCQKDMPALDVRRLKLWVDAAQWK